MKMFLFGVAALGIGGAVIGARGHEAERTISKPPGYVYAAMSAMALAGDQHSTEIPGKPYVFRTEKREGKAIGFSIVREGRTIAEVDFTLAPDGADKTRLSAEADIDQAAMADLVGGSTGAKFASIPKSAFPFLLQRVVNEIGDDVENGTSLPKLRGMGSSWASAWESNTWDGKGMRSADRSWEAQRSQRAAAAPMRTAAPMMDPNDAARDFMNR
ncbi:MAG TPA: hypothetical protein VEZ48_03835 [Sphingomonadaceae bacterium]|nr:hypothetical protein [Sphingomonadaceae bacterium]